MIRRLVLVCSLSVMGLSTPLAADTNDMDQDDGEKVQGVWKIESMDVGMGERARTEVPKAFMMFFGEQHYSAIRDFTKEPEPGAETPDRSFMADAGTYEIEGKDLVVHHQVAGFPVLGSMTFGWSLEDDDTLILTPQYDKMVLPGIDLKPKDGKMGYGDVATRYVFKRLE